MHKDMTLNVGLQTYFVRIRRKRDTQWLQLDQFDGTTDLFTIMQRLLQAKQNQYIDVGDARRRMQINPDAEVEGRTVDGTVDVGAYGFVSTLKDQQGAVSFEREEEHAEMIRLYYRFWCPSRQQFGIFALQSYGVHGCKGAIDRLLALEFAERYPEYSIEVREAVSRSAIEHYVKNGAVKEFTFVQHGINSDWAAGYGGDAVAEMDGEIIVHFKAKRGKSLPWTQRVSDYLLGARSDSQRLFELNTFETDQFKVRLEVDGEVRTLSHTEFVRMTSRIDVTGDIERDAKGYPTRDSIRPLASAMIAKIAEDATVRP